MKIFDIQPEYLKITDFENFFNIYDDGKNYHYNLNVGLYFDINDQDCSTYALQTYAHWPLISYILYGTTHLAWLLMKLNNVNAVDVFKTMQPGDVIKYIPEQSMTEIVKSINDIG